MKRLISLMLAVVMVCVCVPFTALAKGELDDVRLINSNGTIELENESILKNRTADNAKKVTSREMSMQSAVELPYTEDELRSMSLDDLKEKVQPYLADNHAREILSQKDNRIEGLNYGENTDNEKIARIVENKKAYEEKSLEAYEYGHKLASGEIEATQTRDSRFIAVDNVILVSTQDDLADMNNQDGYFRLTNDINITGTWMPIDFYGTFEGNGYTIHTANMSEYGEYDGVGFFSTLGEGAIVQNVNFNSPYVYANAVCGVICAENNGIISNCTVTGGTVATYLWADFENAFWQISGYAAGGICGINYGIIMDCAVDCDVDGWTQIGGIAGINGGIIFASYAGGNVAYETNNWDIDWYGAEYTYYTYGEEYDLPFSTMLRDMWAVYFLLYHNATAYGYNGGITGQNYGYIYDCMVQGRGQGYSYDVGVVGGLDCMGGLAGGDIGHISHCYSLDRAFPVFEDGATMYAAWDYGDNGEGIYYDWAYFLVHKCIGYAVEGALTSPSDEIFYYGSWPLPCDDGGFHGTELTADQFYDPNTFRNWNNGAWNQEWGIQPWVIEAGSVPFFMELIPVPTEYVMTYVVANTGGLLDGNYIAYKLAKPDSNYNYLEPVPPVISATQQGYGVTGWHPYEPQAGRQVYGDMVFKAYFGAGGSTSYSGGGGSSTTPTPSPSPTQNPHFPSPGGPGGTGTAADDNGLTGDVNLDQKINTADATYLLKAIAADQVSELKQQQKKNADTNFDNNINTYDCTRILQYCAGIIKTFR